MPSLYTPQATRASASRHTAFSTQHKQPFVNAASTSPLASSSSPSNPHAEFFFKRRNGKIDWRAITNLNLEQVVNHVDVDTLQEFVESLTFADIGPDDLYQQSDANIVQLIRLAQLIIEYLLNVQNYMLHAQKSKQKTYEMIMLQLSRAKALMIDKEDLIERQKHEIKYLKKVIKAHETNGSKTSSFLTAATLQQQQQHLTLPADGESHQCMYCRSSFINAVYLQSHIHRRHPDELNANLAANTSKHATERAHRDESERESLRRELQRQREEFLDEKRRWEQEREKRQLQRPAPIIVTPPAPIAHSHPTHSPTSSSPAVTQEQLDHYSRELERKMGEKMEAALHQVQQQHSSAPAATQLEGINDKISKLHTRLESLIRGDIPLSPMPRQDGENESDRDRRLQQRHAQLVEQTRSELLNEIRRLKEHVGFGEEARRPTTPQSQTQMQTMEVPKTVRAIPTPQASTPSSQMRMASATPPPRPVVNVTPEVDETQERQTRLRKAAHGHRSKMYATFSAFPALLSRYQHDERDLLASLNSFSDLVDGMKSDHPEAEEGEETRWRTELIRAQGYVNEEKQVMSTAESIVAQAGGNPQLESDYEQTIQRERDLEERQRVRAQQQLEFKAEHERFEREQQEAKARQAAFAKAPLSGAFGGPANATPSLIAELTQRQAHKQQQENAQGLSVQLQPFEQDERSRGVSFSSYPESIAAASMQGNNESSVTRNDFSIHRAASNLTSSPSNRHDSLLNNSRDSVSSVDNEIDSSELPEISSNDNPMPRITTTSSSSFSLTTPATGRSSATLSPLKRVGGGFAAAPPAAKPYTPSSSDVTAEDFEEEF